MKARLPSSCFNVSHFWKTFLNTFFSPFFEISSLNPCFLTGQALCEWRLCCAAPRS